MRTPTNAGLYVHVPFCRIKCGYCDFFSVLAGNLDTLPLVERLQLELNRRLAESPCPVATVFVGGGTPTILPTRQLATLVDTISGSLRDHPVEEFSVEANPGTVDGEKSEVLVRAGVNRVSMGAQSFIPAELAILEREHRPADVAPAVRTLRSRGIEHINIDLMFGIPTQTPATWRQSLQQALELEVDHFACYNLTYEPGTRLAADRDAGRIAPCDERLELEMYETAVEMLRQAGFEQYEISNFARPGCECRHNLIYWRNGPYIGVGPSAAGCIGNRRYKNVSDVRRYVEMIDAQGHAEAEVETLDGEAIMLEMILMQLRLVEGLSIPDFRRASGGEPLTLLQPALGRLQAEGLVSVSPTRVALTQEGMVLANTVMSELACACTSHDREPPDGFE